MTVAQIPEQIARDIIVREYGEIEITRTNVLVDGARLVELIAAGIKAADEQRVVPTVVIRDGEAFHGDDADVVDLDFMAYSGIQSEMDQGDIDDIVERLRGAGFNETAADVLDWWGR